MKKLLFIVLISSFLTAKEDFYYRIFKIDNSIKERMIDGESYKKGCPIPLGDLRYLEVSYIDFNGKSDIGEIIIHKDVAKETVDIFRKLYKINYPIKQMRLVSDFKADDWQSIEADNTSAFNCRNIAGTNRWSKHAYGKAIDINPLENPYISKKGTISHQYSLQYKKRIHKNNSPQDKAILLPNDKATKIFKSYGWIWGGDWNSIKDYQHFEKKR